MFYVNMIVVWVAALQVFKALVCIRTGTHGRNVQTLVDISSDSRRKHSDITAAPCMKLMPKVR